jgi:nicotinamidase-related amidase
MSARIVRRDEATLVVVDVQERLAAAMARREEVVAGTSKLLRAAALLGWPVLVTRQYPQGLGDIDPALRELLATPELAAACVEHFDKTAFCCLDDPGFAAALAATSRRQVVLAGMETHICITQTALAATDRLHDVFVVADACCSRRDDDHALALERMRAEGVVVTTTEPVLYEAVGEAATERFRALLGIVKG